MAYGEIVVAGCAVVTIAAQIYGGKVSRAERDGKITTTLDDHEARICGVEEIAQEHTGTIGELKGELKGLYRD